MKTYTEEQLKRRISKKYHDMIDWEATMYSGFDGWIVLLHTKESESKNQTIYNRCPRLDMVKEKAAKAADVLSIFDEID